jgi:hypothetical protein
MFSAALYVVLAGEGEVRGGLGDQYLDTLSIKPDSEPKSGGYKEMSFILADQ